MVGHGPLEASIGVQIPVPQPKRPLHFGLFLWRITPYFRSKVLFWLSEASLFLGYIKRWKKYSCPGCLSKSVIKRGVRRGKLKFYCKDCSSWFQINRKAEIRNASIISDHFAGLSFRSLGRKNGVNASTVWRRYASEVKKQIQVIDITRNYCSKFCGILLVDGKYISIKGYERKIPVIYGIDYLTHDIVHFVLGTSENYRLLLKFFTSLRLANYPLQALVSDDNQNLPQACLKVYPNAITQLCQNHYKQNLRVSLGLFKDTTYLMFMKNVETLFCRKMGAEEFKIRASKIYDAYHHDDLARSAMLDIAKRSGELTAYTKLTNVPRTTNLIESLNSHLEGRLKTIKGFESFKSANIWLNQYFIQRRLRPFTDCTKQFRSLNGKSSLEITLKDSYKIENLLKLIKWPFLQRCPWQGRKESNLH